MKMIIYFQAKGNKDTCLEGLQVGISEIICCMKFYFANETWRGLFVYRKIGDGHLKQ